MEPALQKFAIVEAALRQSQVALSALLANQECQKRIVAAGNKLSEVLHNGGKVYSCGNGGSMCDAMHFAEELSGRFRKDRKPFAAMAISDPSHLSCVGNDIGYDEVFARFVEAHMRAPDVLLAISTSGKSKNVLRAVQAAKAQGAYVIGLCAEESSPLGLSADLTIATPGFTPYADRVQELHIKVIHTLIELIEADHKERG